MSHLISVIVCDLDVVRIPLDKLEADAPLVVDGDGELPLPVAPKPVQPIAAGYLQVIQVRNQVDVLELSPRTAHYVRRQPFRLPGREQFLCVPVRERLDHQSTVTCHETLVYPDVELHNVRHQLRREALSAACWPAIISWAHPLGNERRLVAVVYEEHSEDAISFALGEAPPADTIALVRA